MFGRRQSPAQPAPPAGPVVPAARSVPRGEKVGKLLLVHIDTTRVPPDQADEYVAGWVERYAAVVDKLPVGWGVLYVPCDRSEVTMLELT